MKYHDTTEDNERRFEAVEHLLFTVDEMKTMGELIKCIYDRELTLCEFTEEFMRRLKPLIYFDKSDFMFFKYNQDTKKYEMESFRPVNWSNEEIHNYITTYMHNDDVLPILSQPEYIAFRNSDLFSLLERRETPYFQEFARSASLEISIDANIPLPAGCDTVAILGIFRSVEKVEFKERDLEIIKLLQPHLSNRMRLDICNGKCKGDGRCKGERKCKEENGSVDSTENWSLNNIETLGLCAYDSSANIVSNNASFSTFAKTYSSSIEDSKLTQEVTKCVRQLLFGDLFQLGPIPIHINDDTYMIQLAYNDTTKSKITVAIYYISDVFSKRLTALKEEYNLSSREFEIIFLSLKRSLTNAEIARELYISEATVKRHLYTIYQKIGVKNQKQLFRELQMI